MVRVDRRVPNEELHRPVVAFLRCHIQRGGFMATVRRPVHVDRQVPEEEELHSLVVAVLRCYPQRGASIVSPRPVHEDGPVAEEELHTRWWSFCDATYNGVDPLSVSARFTWMAAWAKRSSTVWWWPCDDAANSGVHFNIIASAVSEHE